MNCLGVKIDQTLRKLDQISNVCRASFLELMRLGFIRPYLSKKTSARLVAALITSRLDYCNSVLAGLPAEQVGLLQRVENTAARLVLKNQKRDYITPLLNELYCCLWNSTANIGLKSCLPSLRRYNSLIPFGFSLHVSDLTNPPIFE